MFIEILLTIVTRDKEAVALSGLQFFLRELSGTDLDEA